MHADNFEQRINLEGDEVGSFRFLDSLTIRVPIGLSEKSPELIRLEIDSNCVFGRTIRGVMAMKGN